MLLTGTLVLACPGCQKPTPESIVREMHAKFTDMIAILKGVTDESSAKAAGPLLRAKMEEMSALKKQFDALNEGKTGAEKRAALAEAEKMTKEAGHDPKEFNKELRRISKHKSWIEPIEDAMKGLKVD